MYTEELKKKQKTLDERKQKLKRNATRSELIMQGLLLSLKHVFGKPHFQKGFIAGHGYCIVDFYIPKIGLCIEVDGDYHFTDQQIKKDWYKNKYLTVEREMRVFRIRNEEVVDLAPKQLLKMISNLPTKSVTYSPKYRK